VGAAVTSLLFDLGKLARWHADTLLALDGALPRAQVVMAYPTELLFQLLIDRLRWLDRE
jgi:hypothetical protein